MQSKEWMVIAVIAILIGLGALIFGRSKLLGGFFIGLGILFLIGVVYFSNTITPETYAVRYYNNEKIIFKEKGIYATYDESNYVEKKGVKTMKTKTMNLMDCEAVLTNKRIILSERVAFTAVHAPVAVFYWNKKDIDSTDWKPYNTFLSGYESLKEYLPYQEIKPPYIEGGYRFGIENQKEYLLMEYQSTNIPNKKDIIKIWFSQIGDLRESLKEIRTE